MSDGIIESNLGNRMRVYAQGKSEDDLPKGFLRAADRFDECCRGFYLANPQTCTVMQVVGSFAKARRLWCEATGESLI